MELDNKRAISLLNVSYKIMAKALALRVQPVLGRLIDANQSAFLPARFILDNIFLANETVKWAEESGQEMVMMNIDFAKAYDHVEWDFLVRLLEKFAFGPTFLRQNFTYGCVCFNHFEWESHRGFHGFEIGEAGMPFDPFPLSVGWRSILFFTGKRSEKRFLPRHSPA